MGTKLKAKQKGFTIIEVSIVLAIAGLIMAIVFFAVPALERNARNTQRNSDATHLAGLVTDYQANHNGSLSTSMTLSGESWSNWTGTPTAVQVTSAGAGISYGSLTAGVVNINGTCDRSTGTITYTANSHFAIGYKVETTGAAQNVCIDGS